VRRLIVNADDFGLCAGVDEGIVELAERGIVTSVSVLAELVRPAAAGDLLARAPGVGIGLHVDFTSDLVRFAPDDLGGRLARQLERFTALFGRPPDHLDTHKHVHRDHGAALEPLLAVGVPIRATTGAMRRRLRARGIACPDGFAGGVGPRPALTPGRIAALLRNLDRGTTELMCHPALRWDGPGQLRYGRQRVGEHAALIASRLCERAAALGVELTGFSCLGAGSTSPPGPAPRHC
jgi:predicted glycoside hydrolase/deacetylase ChbG (UPF0249 family)